MPVDIFAFATTKMLIENKTTLGPQDSTPIALVAAMHSNPMVALFVGQAMAQKKAAELAAATPAPVLTPAPAGAAVPVPTPTPTGAAAPVPTPSPTGAAAIAATTSGTPSPAGASPSAPVVTVPTGPQFEKIMSDVSAKANDFITKAEKQLNEVQQAANQAEQAAREAKDAADAAREAALATKAKVEEALTADAALASAQGGRWSGGKHTRRSDPG